MPTEKRSWLQAVAGTIKAQKRFIWYLVPEVVWPRHVIMDDASISVRHTPYSFHIKRYLSRLDYENPERALIRELVRPGDQVLEMGGSIGVLTAILAERVGNERQGCLDQANERLTDYSSRWLRRYSQALVLPGIAFPVFRIEGGVRASFREHQGSLGGLVDFELGGNGPQGPEARGKTYCISDIIQSTGMSPTVLIVDIEGSECITLDVSMECPESIRVIIIEMHRHIYGDEMLGRIVRTIERSGFTATRHIADVYAFERQRSAS